jgi:polygalacturonase
MHMSIIARSSRTATLLLAPEGAAFRLPDPVSYRLTTRDGAPVLDGIAERTVVLLDGLDPETLYALETADGALTFATRSCSGCVDITEFGGDPAARDNADAIQQAIDAVPPGGTLVVPSGRYLSGPLFLHSDMTVYLRKGAELAAISDWSAWPVLPERDRQGRVVGTWEGLPAKSFAALVNAVGCSGIRLTGEGILDGGGDRGDWWTWPKETRLGARRPRTVFLAHCNDIELTGLTVRNSPSWTIHPYGCRDLVAAALKIVNPPDSPNTDGLNPESCENVLLTGLHFSVGDDCIAVKAGKRDGARTDHLAPTRNLTVSHCLMERGHGAVVLGSEMSGGITDVSIRNCHFAGTDRGLRIKTRRGRGGKVARVRMSDVSMNGVATVFSANAFYFCDADGMSEKVQSRLPAPVDDSTPHVGDITIENVLARNVQLAAVVLLGLPEAPFTGIRLDNMAVSFDPDAEAGVPLMAGRVPACRHERLLADFADISGSVRLIDGNPGDAD